MPRYTTTNLRFPTDVYRELRLEAQRRQTTLAGVVREAVARYLGRADDGAAPEFGQDPADALVGCIEGSPGDESVNHDHYLYGWTRETADDPPRGHERPARSPAPRRPAPRRRR